MTLSTGARRVLTDPVTGQPLTSLGVRPPSRRTRSVLFVEDAKNPMCGMTNDGVGAAYRDCEVPFGDACSFRLDPQGNTTANTNPGTSVDNSGVVFKRRVQHSAFTAPGLYAFEGWIRWTSGGNQSNCQTSISMYNRDGTNEKGGRIWIDTTQGATGTVLSYLDGTSRTYTSFLTYPSVENSQHKWDLINLPTQLDIGGGWHYFRFIVNYSTQQYVSFQFNEVTTSLAGVTMYSNASANPTMLHFSVEYGARTNFRRFINVARLVGEHIG